MTKTGEHGGTSLTRVGRLTALLVTISMVGVAASMTFGQQVRSTQTAQVRSDELVYNWEKNEFDFTGNCKLTIAGGYDAEMSAPQMSVKLSAKSDEIVHLIAHGLVKFHILTRPNTEGIRYSIDATAQKQALYRESEQIVELSGGAEADLVAVGVDGQTARFVGQKITADLKTSRLIVDDANVKIQTPLRD